MEELLPIEIETRNRRPKDIIDDMIGQLYKAGFHENGQVVLGDFQAYLVERETDGLKSILFRFSGKLDFLLLGGTAETYNDIDNILSARNLTVCHLATKGKSPHEVMKAFVTKLTEVSPQKGEVTEYVISFGKSVDDDGKIVFVIEVAGVLRMILDDADVDFMKKLVG